MINFDYEDMVGMPNPRDLQYTSTSYNDNSFIDQWWENCQVHLKRSYRWGTSKQALFAYEILIGIFIPAATISAKARKTVSIINSLYDEMTA